MGQNGGAVKWGVVIGGNARAIRLLKKLLQKDVARGAVDETGEGLRGQEISDLECGRVVNPKMEFIARVARGLGVNPLELIGGLPATLMDETEKEAL